MNRLWLVSAFSAGIASAVMLPSFGQTIVTPDQIVKQVYAPYVEDVDDRNFDWFSLISDRAAERLRYLIARDETCVTVTKGICRIDFDPVIGAQDYEFDHKYPILSSKPSSGGETVSAHFVNGDVKTEVDFDFVKWRERWVIDDVRGNSQLFSWDLLEILEEKF